MKTKRFLSILLSLVLVLGMFPGMSMTALADGNTTTITPGTDEAKTGTGTMTIKLKIFEELTEANKPTVSIKRGETPITEGAPQIGDVLTANTTAKPVSYQWYRDGAAIEGATESTYTLTAGDVGSIITVKATQAADADGEGHPSTEQTQTSAATPAVEKKTNTTAQIPAETLSGNITKTGTSITIGSTDANYEYVVVPKDTTPDWTDPAPQTGNSSTLTFGSLTAGTDYDVYVRATGNENYNPGEATKITVSTNVEVTITSTTSTQGKEVNVTLTPAKTGVTYKWYIDDSPTPDGTGTKVVPSKGGSKLKVEVYAGVPATLIGEVTTETTIRTLAVAISGSTADPVTLTLDGPITGDISVPVNKNVQLDLNGQEVSGGITVPAGSTLTINDTSETKTGTVKGTVSANTGAVTILGGRFDNTPTATETGTVTVRGGLFKNSPTALLKSPYEVKASGVDGYPNEVYSTFVALTTENQPTVAITKAAGNTDTAPQIGDTLTATTAAKPVTYQWYRDGAAIGGATESTYTLTAGDVGSIITVKATQAANADGEGHPSTEQTQTSAATPAVEKKTNTTAQIAAETLSGNITKTGTSITISSTDAAYEYVVVPKGTTPNWTDPAPQTGNSGTLTFGSLTAGTDYDVYVRAKAYGDYQPGEATKITVSTNVEVTITSTTSTQGQAVNVTLTPAKTGVTYKWYIDDSPTPDGTGTKVVPSKGGSKLKVEVYAGDPATLIGTVTTDTTIKTLAEAISESTANPVTLTLDGPVTGGISVPAGKEVRLDLNGNTLTGNVTVATDAKLSVKDSTGGGKVTGSVENHGATTIEGGAFDGNVTNDGQLVIYNGTFSGTVTNEPGTDETGAVTILDGTFKAAVRNNPSGEGSGTVYINGGTFDARPTAIAEGISISGGRFKVDPTKNGTDPNPHVSIPDNAQIYTVNGNYPYQLGEKPNTGAADVKVDQGETIATVAGSIASGDVATATGVAESTTANLEGAAVEELQQIVKDSTAVTDDSKNIVIVPALTVEVEAYVVGGENTTLTLDITATYKSYETDSGITSANGVESNKNDPSKVKEIGSGTLDTKGTPITVKIEVPADFATALGASESNISTDPVTVYVKHTHDGRNYEYPASLYYDSSKYFVEFVNPNGFSPFTLSKTSASKVKVNIGGEDRYYTDLQSAIDDAPDGSVITKVGDGDVSAQLKTAKAITIDTDGKDGTVTITAASTLNLTTTAKGEGKTEYKATVKSSGGGYSGGGYSGGTSSTSSYPPTINNPAHGKISVNPSSPRSGAKVTINTTPDAGYEVDTVTVTDASGKSVAVTKNADGTYSFTQPSGKVTVNVTFKPTGAKSTAEVFAPYSDLNAAQWYAEGIRYCIENGIMSGYGDGRFGPNDATSRAQLATILYNMEGKPAATGTTNFTDVKAGDWFADAIRWASAEGIVGGYGDGKFGPNDTLTREQLVTILYRYAKLKGVDTSARADLSAFSDAANVSDWAKDAMQWAVAMGIINGMDGKLNAQGEASRAQIATIIMRYQTEVAK